MLFVRNKAEPGDHRRLLNSDALWTELSGALTPPLAEDEGKFSDERSSLRSPDELEEALREE